MLAGLYALRNAPAQSVEWRGEEHVALLSDRLLGCIELRLQDGRTERPYEHVAL